jgi:uncharacterized protein YlaI
MLTSNDKISKIKSLLSYFSIIIKKALRKFELNKNINRKQRVTNTETIYISMSYYHDFSIILANKIKMILDLPNKKIRFVFKSQTRICSLFNSIYREKKKAKNQVIYQYNCQNCKSSYIDQTSRDVEQRKLEHQNAFKGTENSKIADHSMENKHQNHWNYKILAIESNHTKRLIKESLLMDMIQQSTDRIIYSQKNL